MIRVNEFRDICDLLLCLDHQLGTRQTQAPGLLGVLHISVLEQVLLQRYDGVLLD